MRRHISCGSSSSSSVLFAFLIVICSASFFRFVSFGIIDFLDLVVTNKTVYNALENNERASERGYFENLCVSNRSKSEDNITAAH